MKRGVLMLLGTIVMFITLNGQVVLTSATHGFRVGDSHDFILMKNAEEGIAGTDVIWDFTSLEESGKSLTSHMLATEVTDKTKSIPNSNFVLEEFGNHFVFNVTNDRMEQYGTVSCNSVTTYDKPFLKLKFPLQFGDHFSGPYSGTQVTNSLSVPVSGYYYIDADSYGTLLLPDNIELRNVLRVKQTRTIVNPDGTEIYEITYRWYAAEVRYPVLVISKYVYPQATSYVQTAMFAHIQDYKKNSLAVADAGIISDIQVFPNPYENELTISYNISKPGTVKIDLYDVSGKLFRNIQNNKSEDIGYKTILLDESELGIMPGIFYLRINVDGTAYTRKIVKL
jgi:hypothetical protein